MKRIPVIDYGKCTVCESCIEICPSVFKLNDDTGLIEVLDLPVYPDSEIEEAIIICPADCISF